MADVKDFLSRFGSNVAGSLGTGGAPDVRPGPTMPAAPSGHDGTTRLKAGSEIDVDRIAHDPGQLRTESDPGALARLEEA